MLNVLQFADLLIKFIFRLTENFKSYTFFNFYYHVSENFTAWHAFQNILKIELWIFKKQNH